MKDIERVYASIYAPDGQLLKSGELAHDLLLRENGITPRKKGLIFYGKIIEGKGH